jgi:hypothetical protein
MPLCQGVCCCCVELPERDGHIRTGPLWPRALLSRSLPIVGVARRCCEWGGMSPC